ncbi:MAG: TolC family protein [Balneolaceae bacterium]|nr:MAG: TolC family protein [Balneolaceae bacterium]
MIHRITVIIISFLLVQLLFPQNIFSQDTLRVSLQEFIEIGLENSGQVAYESRAVDLAGNRLDNARSQRILPRIDFSSQHGVIPGVVSQLDIPRGQLYLDPDLENDWEDWAIFTRAEISAVQPVFSWGAINRAVSAAEAAARASSYQFSAVKAEAEMQLFELYYSYLLAMEISRIIDEARDQIDQVDRTLQRMRDDGDPDLKESDLFKFDILKTEFEVEVVEVRESMNFIKRVWNYALRATDSQKFMPAESFLDPIAYVIEDFDHYQNIAMHSRPELRGVEFGIEALRNSVEAVKAQQYPFLFLGITGSYANTPNRPRQTNPFIINSTNFATAGIGFGIRQNLNFSSMRNSVERTQIEYRRVQDLHHAVSDGVTLELNEKYRAALIAETKMKQTEAALSIARNWVRNEQLNYDIGFGDVEDLLDSLQKELELRIQLKQNVFELNKRVAELYKASGISVNQLQVN